jgi:recombination protein RecA
MAGIKNTVEFYRTHLHSFNRMTGGGLPKGRVIEVYGDPSVGKTTLAFALITDLQKQGKVLFLDFEHALDESYMYACGVDPKKIKIVEPRSLEEGLDVVLDEMRKDKSKYIAIIIDSISEMTPLKELESGMEKDAVALLARKVNQFLKKVSHDLKRHKAVIVAINQAREKIGGYGNPITSSGGRGFKHKCALRLYCTGGKSDRYPDGGCRLRIWQKKNKVATEITDNCEYHIERGTGIDAAIDYLDLALEQGILKKKGPGNYQIGAQTFRGWAAAVEALKKSKAFADFLETL